MRHLYEEILLGAGAAIKHTLYAALDVAEWSVSLLLEHLGLVIALLALIYVFFC